MSTGWIKLYRKITELPEWQAKPYDEAHALVDLLVCANHKDQPVLFHGRYEECKRGELVTSSYKLAERWGWSRGKVRLFLARLTKKGYIKAHRKAHRFLRITFCNYDAFPLGDVGKKPTDQPTERPTDTRDSAPGAQPQAPNNLKKIKKKDYIGPDYKKKRGGDPGMDEFSLTPEVKAFIREQYPEEVRQKFQSLQRDGIHGKKHKAAMDKFYVQLLQELRQAAED